MSFVNEDRLRYVHDEHCTEKLFGELNDRGLKICLECNGVFQADGLGAWVDDKRFDENWTPELGH